MATFRVEYSRESQAVCPRLETRGDPESQSPATLACRRDYVEADILGRILIRQAWKAYNKKILQPVDRGCT